MRAPSGSANRVRAGFMRGLSSQHSLFAGGPAGSGLADGDAPIQARRTLNVHAGIRTAR